jgi:hypothetical protein
VVAGCRCCKLQGCRACGKSQNFGFLGKVLYTPPYSDADLNVTDRLVGRPFLFRKEIGIPNKLINPHSARSLLGVAVHPRPWLDFDLVRPRRFESGHDFSTFRLWAPIPCLATLVIICAGLFKVTPYTRLTPCKKMGHPQ